MKRFKHADKHTVLKRIPIINMECVWSYISLKQREHQPYLPSERTTSQNTSKTFS